MRAISVIRRTARALAFWGRLHPAIPAAVYTALITSYVWTGPESQFLGMIFRGAEATLVLAVLHGLCFAAALFTPRPGPKALPKASPTTAQKVGYASTGAAGGAVLASGATAEREPPRTPETGAEDADALPFLLYRITTT